MTGVTADAAAGASAAGDAGLAGGAVAPRYRWYLPCKFTLEWLVALALLAPCAAVIGALAALVKLSSPGPAFYRQRRVGRDGREFTMIKLRTMVPDSEVGTGPVWSQPGDPRVTPVGRVLRDTHLDELPQIWNVLRGEMSWVGPRPERPEIVQRLERTIPNYRDRLLARPGLTGLAQMQLPPDSDDLSVRRKLAYDRYYVARVSPWLDLRIALSTCLYMSSGVLKALCDVLVRSYGRDVEHTFGGEAAALLDEGQVA
jgi:lipopolysaccharide/colanic/teichoic acid biosynthesis glycosyltransferase